MDKPEERFAKLLTRAVWRIKRKENKNISIIQDQLGYMLDKTGGSMIEHWRKGNVPGDLSDAITLAEELVRRNGLINREELQDFLLSAGHLNPVGECDKLFPAPPLQRPARVAHFIGRKEEMQKLLAELKPGNIVTLCGPGGIGKTALVAETIWSLAPEDVPPERFPDGIIFHNFYTEPQASIAFERIAEAFGEKVGRIPRDAAQRALTGRRALLVLDGAENADDLPAVLAIQDHCGVLITSREKMVAPTEWTSLGPLLLDESVTLLQAWGQRRAADNDAARRICDLVGNLPLAIRLAGSYMATGEQDAAEYLAWLETTGLEALDQGERQHLSIKILLKKSLDQVGEASRQVMAVVGLLALAPFNRHVIATVLKMPEPKTVRPLADLVIYSLLERPVQRYSVTHALVHTYARQYLMPQKEVSDRLTKYHLTLAKEQAVRGSEGFPRLDDERPHLMDTLTRCVGLKEWKIVRTLSGTIDDYLDLQGHWTHRMTALKANQVAAFELGDFDNEANTIQRIGTIHLQQGKWDKALELYETALNTYRELGDRLKEARVLSNIGICYRRKGNWNIAHKNFDLSLQIMRELGNRQGEAATLNNIAMTYFQQRRFQEAEQIYLENIKILQEVDDPRAEGQARGMLAMVYYSQGRLDEALPMAQSSQSIFKDLGDRFNEGQVTGVLGDIYRLQGNLDKAVKTYQTVAKILTELGDVLGLGFVSMNLGRVFYKQDRLDKAEQAYRKAQVTYRTLGDNHHEGIVLMELAPLYEKKHEQQQALSLRQEALAKLNPESPEYENVIKSLEAAEPPV